MNTEPIEVPGCKGTTVHELLLDEGVQVLKVEVEPGGEIPLHSHECAATMVITKGSARTLGKDARAVRTGDVVVKSPNEPHGFTDVSEQFQFISISDHSGILQKDSWDLKYSFRGPGE
jgi:quercetin dioxygenase-like cupin family protein